MRRMRKVGVLEVLCERDCSVDSVVLHGVELALFAPDSS